MIDMTNILRLAGDGYDARDIRQFTRTPIEVIKQVCKEAGVKLNVVSDRPKPVVMVVKNPQAEAINRYQVKQAAKYASPQKEILPPKAKENPLHFARTWLCGRLKEKPSGYWLDDLPVSLDGMMIAANTVAKKRGAEMCLHSERWKP